LLQLAGVVNQEIPPFLDWLESQVRQLHVDIRLNTPVTASLIDILQPDVVLIATGSQFLNISVPGVERKEVLNGNVLLEMMEGRANAKRPLLSLTAPIARYVYAPALVRLALRTNVIVKKKVAIIGGQLSGCKLALYLSMIGKDVTIIEESDSYGSEMEETAMDALRYEIQDGNVTVMTGVRVQEITAGGVTLSDSDGKRVFQKADTVIVALGLSAKPHHPAGEFAAKVEDVVVIGDAKGFRGIREAVSDGFEAAFRL